MNVHRTLYTSRSFRRRMRILRNVFCQDVVGAVIAWARNATTIPVVKNSQRNENKKAIKR